MKQKSNTLYLECQSGISGDMTVAALLDLGADQEVLEKVLSTIPVQGFKTRVSRVKKAGLDVCDFEVELEEENHDHDMEYLYGHEHNHEHEHNYEIEHNHENEHHHEHEHNHEHGHSHENADKHNHHEHRGLAEIVAIIEAADMTAHAKALAIRIFEILAKAESKAHGVPMEQVHFHEVGAVDSIIDIISVAVCLDNLQIQECIVPVICEGRGTVRCQHGILPIPVPAVINIVEQNQLHLSIVDVQGEFVTPTGAAIVAAVKTSDALPENFTVERIGMGAGKRAYERPGILRAMLIQGR